MAVGLAVRHLRPEFKRMLHASLQCLHLGQPFAGLDDAPLNNLPHYWAGRVAVVGHTENLGYFVQLEAEVFGAQHEVQPIKIGSAEATITIVCICCWNQQTYARVITNRIRGDSRRPGKLTDFHGILPLCLPEQRLPHENQAQPVCPARRCGTLRQLLHHLHAIHVPS